MDWKDCPDVERIPGTISGAWLVKGTRIRVGDLLTNAADFTPEQIATETYEGLPVDRARRVTATSVSRITQNMRFAIK